MNCRQRIFCFTLFVLYWIGNIAIGFPIEYNTIAMMLNVALVLYTIMVPSYDIDQPLY